MALANTTQPEVSTWQCQYSTTAVWSGKKRGDFQGNTFAI